MPVCRKDLEGILCLIMSYSLYVVAYYLTMGHVIRPIWSGSKWGYLNLTLIHTGLVLSLYSYLRATFSDPGMVPLSNVKIDFSDFPSRGKGYPTAHPSQSSGDESHESQENWTMCKSCESYKPPQAVHCRKCKRCINGQDHHCVWINNCVGRRNKKFFILFCFYTTTLCCYLFIFSLISWYVHRKTMEVIDIILMLISLPIFILFGLFTGGTLGDQIMSSIWEHYSHKWIFINGKRVKKIKKPMKLILQEIFGHKWVCLWLLPCISPSISITDTHII